MNGYCANCPDYGEVYHYRIIGLGLRYLDAKCIAWMQAAGMEIQPVTDADPRRPVRGKREVWTRLVRLIETGKRAIVA